MARGTLTLLFILGIISSLLLGITIGKKIPGDAQVLSSQDVIPSTSPLPSSSPTPTKTVSVPTARITRRPPISPRPTKKTSASLKTTDGITTLTDRECGISVKFPESFVQQKIENANSKIFTDPDRPNEMIALVCQETIPEPPLPPENTESTILAGVAATLYHDQQRDGSPREEIIARHPTLNHDILIAGWGPAFDDAVSSFRFLQ